MGRQLPPVWLCRGQLLAGRECSGRWGALPELLRAVSVVVVWCRLWLKARLQPHRRLLRTVEMGSRCCQPLQVIIAAGAGTGWTKGPRELTFPR